MNSPPSVLVLDDSEDLLELIKLSIEKLCDVNVIATKSMREVEAVAEKVLTCKLAILDINLGPGEPSGLDVYRWLRGKGFTGAIFFLTGHARSHPLVAEAARLKDVTVLNKPIAADELVKIVGGLT